MGLTIHYNISFKGNVQELNNKLESIRQKCLDLPFEQVDEVEHTIYTKEDISYYLNLQAEGFHGLITTDLRDRLLSERGLDLWTLINLAVYHPQKKIKDREFIKFGIWAGRGCEGTSLTFIKKKLWWNCHSFTKTQYSEEFVKCHLLVIKVLDLFKEAGFKVVVHDKGGYWRVRDLRVLGKNINDYTSMIASIFGGLQKAVENTNITLETPITKCQNYMKVEEQDG